jgi:hypothetical protein
MGRVFEAVAEEAVEGDVGDPDEGDGRGQMPVLKEADEEESEGEGEGVGEVVGCGAEADVDEIAEHEEVGCQEEDCEKEPAVVEVLVDEEGEEEEDGFFGAEEEGGAGQHERFIRDCGGDRSPITAKAEADSSAALRNDNQEIATAKMSRGKDKNSRRSFDSLRLFRMTNFYFDLRFLFRLKVRTHVRLRVGNSIFV